MNSWADVVLALLRLLEKPTGLGVMAIALILAFLMWLIPVGGLLYTQIDGTHQIVNAIKELKSTVNAKSIALRH